MASPKTPLISAKQEVEVRALLSTKEKQHVLSRLSRLRARRHPVESLVDSYFCPIGVKSFREIEMDEIGSYSLRLRKQQSGARLVAQMNVKRITSYGDHNAWDEHETPIENFEEARSILLAIGFKEFFALRKKRTPFSVGKFHVLLEDIEGFGSVIEVEVITTRARAEAAKANIHKLLADLRIDAGRVVPKSVTNILMRQGAKF